MVHKVWGSRINPKIVEMVRKHCIKNRLLMQTFIEDALVHEMEGKRYDIITKTRNSIK